MPLKDMLLRIDSYLDPTPTKAIDQAVGFCGGDRQHGQRPAVEIDAVGRRGAEVLEQYLAEIGADLLVMGPNNAPVSGSLCSAARRHTYWAIPSCRSCCRNCIRRKQALRTVTVSRLIPGRIART